LGKANDKKVVRQARVMLLVTMSNLLMSHRERPRKGKSKKDRAAFSLLCGLPTSTVEYIETGRFLELKIAPLNQYLAAAFGKCDRKFKSSVKKVYDGLKEVDALLARL
jgi:hypothetical protein